jgi:hypothetical protein
MGQTLISAGLIVIVTIAVINANRLVINSQTTKLEAQARLEAADIAMEIITEARRKKFDEKADTAIIRFYQSPGQFTPYTQLGRDSVRWTYDKDYGPINPVLDTLEMFARPDRAPYLSLSRYDDFDDYNGYSRTVSSTTMTGYVVHCRVYYATQTYPDRATTSRTYVKTMEIYVSHPQYLLNAVRFSMTKTY